jgi:hypothetical protein
VFTKERELMSGNDELALPWARYALTRIQQLTDKDRDTMSDDELSVYTYASNALAGGDPVIAFFARGPGHRLCRVCGAEWSSVMAADHVSGCPVPERGNT